MSEIDDAVALLRKAGWTVAEPITQDNCPHPPHLVIGSCGIGADGSGHSKSTCRQCGKHWESQWGPKPGYQPPLIWNAA